MSIDIVGILDVIVSQAMASGLFDRVNTHEPKSSPGNGLHCAIWVDRVEPARMQSGLDATSIRLTFNVRVYSNMTQEPQDAIDSDIVHAIDVLMTGYSGDFNLGGEARNIDLLGSTGPGLFAQAGYVSQDSKMFRVVTILVPVIVNDVWTQTA